MPYRHSPRSSRIVRTFFVCALWALAPIPARGQTVVDPTTAEFSPSADHSALDNGVPIVNAYELGFYLIGAAQPFQVLPLGKPAPQGDGLIRVVFTGLMGAVPTPGINYEARVSAVGPGGVGTSAPSNQFSFTAPPVCTFGASPTSQSVAAAGGTGNVSVTTTSGCAWTAASNAGWITITSGASGTGSGGTNYSVAVNTSTIARSGTLTVAGQTVTVSQSGACSFTVSPTSQTIGVAGGTASVSVTTTSGCTWTATSSVTWITVTAGSSGTGSGTVTYSVGAANATAERSGTLTVAGQLVTVSQSAAPAPPSELRIVLGPAD